MKKKPASNTAPSAGVDPSPGRGGMDSGATVGMVVPTSAATIRMPQYQFQLEICNDEGTPLKGRRLVRPDFERAVHDVYFDAFRAGRLSEYAPSTERARIVPRFLAEESPQARGFRVEITDAQGKTLGKDFGLGYFKSRAQTLLAEVATQQALAEDATPRYQLLALVDERVPAPARSGFQWGAASVRVPVRVGNKPSTTAWDTPSRQDVPVVWRRSLLDEAVAEAARHPGQEIGGLLLGHLRQTPNHGERPGEVFVEVTCLVPGEGTTEATASSVTFTPDTFAKARELIGLRARSGADPEIIVGWHHSHPFRVCDECPLPIPPECIAKILFYSLDDLQLMESTFSEPFMVGLLSAVEPRLEAVLGHAPVRLFGWRHGEILARGFEVWED